MALVKSRFALTAAITSVVLLISCSPDNETLICNNWKLGVATISDRAEHDAWVQKQLLEARTTLIQQGLSPDQINSAMREIERYSAVGFLRGSLMSFKDDHSFSFSPPDGLQKEGASAVAGTWALKRNTLTSTQVLPDQKERSDTSEIVSLSKSQLVLRAHGTTTTWISSR